MLPIVDRYCLQAKNSQLNNFQTVKPLVSKPPLLSCEICVIVPVRNEAENIATTLKALRDQIDLDSKPFAKNRYEIIILANNCTDNSTAIAHHFARENPNLNLHIIKKTLSPDRAYIGWVRKLLMDEAYRRLSLLGRTNGVIASTDGDTRVSNTWLAAILNEIKNGADAVGGRIITDFKERSALDKVTRLYFLRYVGYRYLVAQLEAFIDPDGINIFPRHHQNFGANLAVTAQMYAKVGGLPPVRTPEDVAFYQALMRADARFRHSTKVRVYTSARMIGRAPAGLAKRLNELNDMGHKHQSLLVESASLVENRFRLRRQLRCLWQRQQNGENLSIALLAIFADKLAIDSELLLDTILLSQTFGLLVEKIGQYQLENKKLYPSNFQFVKIERAIANLRDRVNNFQYFKENRSLKVTNKKQISFPTNKFDCSLFPVSYSLNRRSLNSFKQIEPIFLFPQSF
jgi:glycosyltransferase involved in cell wall biosynthesis